MPKQKAKLTKDQMVMLEKLSRKIEVLGDEYRYIPVWFRKISKDTWEILPHDMLPKEVVVKLNMERESKAKRDQKIITREGPMTEQELRTHIIRPFRK